METTHTPGPWEWRDGDELRRARATRDDGRYGDLVLVASYDYDRGPYLNTTDANRALIAAAPDLLDASAAIGGALSRGLMAHEGNVIIEMSRAQAEAIVAAIAKAKGQP